MSELRKAIIDNLIGYASGFYFEGSDEETEREEYAPKVSDNILSAILQALPEEKDSKKEHVYNYHEVNGYNKALSEVRNIIIEAMGEK